MDAGEERVGVVHAKRSGELPTGVGFIVVEQESGRNCIVIDPGANALLSARNDDPQVQETLRHVGEPQPDGSSKIAIRGRMFKLY